MMFTTKDQDNDVRLNGNCAIVFHLVGGTMNVIVRIQMDCIWREIPIYLQKELPTIFG